MSSSQTTEIRRVRKRQSMEASQVVVQSTPVGLRSGMTISRRSTNVLSSRGMGSSIVREHGEVGRLSKDTFETISGNRGKEKKDLSDLNVRLASFIENTKFLEANVKSLTAELERLRNAKGMTQERVRDEYKEELDTLRETLAHVKKELAELQTKNLALEDKLDTKDDELEMVKTQREEFRSELAKVSNMIGNLEGELVTNKRNVENLEREKKIFKEEVERLRIDNDRVRSDCDAARCKQIELQNECDAILAEKQFDYDTMNAEIEERNDIIEELRRVTPQIQNRWKSDFQEMIKYIQEEYNNKVETIENECRRRYEDQIIQIQNAQVRDNTDSVSKTENKTLQSSLTQSKSKLSDMERENNLLRSELDAFRARFDAEREVYENEKAKLRGQVESVSEDLQTVVIDLNHLRSDNLNLSLEISCYRKLLEGEERKMASSIEMSQNIQSSGGAALASIIGGGADGFGQSSQFSGGAALASIIGGGGGGGGFSQSSQSSNPQKDKSATKPVGAGQQPPKNKAPAVSKSSGTVRMQGTSEGPIGVKEVNQGGSFIVLNNTNKSEDMNLEGWVLERKYGRSGDQVARFTFPKNTVLKAGRELRIFSYNFADEAESDDLVTDSACETFGTGNGSITLIDFPGKDQKAQYTISYQHPVDIDTNDDIL